MWGNLGNVVGGAVGGALNAVQKFQHELEDELNASVGVSDTTNNGGSAGTFMSDPNNFGSGMTYKPTPVKATGEDARDVIDEMPDTPGGVEDSFITTASTPSKLDGGVGNSSASMAKAANEWDMDFPIGGDTPAQDSSLQDVNLSKDTLESPEVHSMKAQVLESQLQVVREEFARYKEKEKAKLQHYIAKAKQDAEQEYNKHRASEQSSQQAEWDKEKDKLRSKLREITSKLKETNNAVKEKDAKVSDLMNKVDSSEREKASEKAKFESEIAQSQKQCKRLEEDVRKLEAQLQEREQQAVSQLASSADTGDEKSEELVRKIQEQHEQLTENNKNIHDLNVEVQALQIELNKAKDASEIAAAGVHEKTKFIAELQKDIQRMKEVVSERERSLETSTTKYAETHALLEDSQRKIADLEAKVSEKDDLLKRARTASSGESDLRKQMSKLSEELKGKDERLASFEFEGQNLAKRQGELEKLVRTKKKEVVDRDNEIKKLIEGKDTLTKQLEDVREQLTCHQSEATNASKNLNAMHAVSQATTEKLSKLEAEVHSKADEIASQKRALESTWGENSELKRTIAELRAERDDFKRQIGAGESRVIEESSSRRDIEQREAVLRATNKQLQESLQRQMAEASMREERLREEASEMRKRWQDAITSRENIAAELGGATAPLLRQISSLQDNMRVKTEGWQAVESALSERALRAESTMEIAEHKRVVLDEQLLSEKSKTSRLQSQIEKLQNELQTTESSLDGVKRAENLLREKVTELDSRLALENSMKQSFENSLRDIEIRHKTEMQDLRESHTLLTKQYDTKISTLTSTNQDLKEEIADERKKWEKGSARKKAQHAIAQVTEQMNDHEQVKTELFQEDADGKAKAYTYLPSILPNGDTSYAALERLQQQIHRKDEETRALTVQLNQLQTARDALLEEVSYLSSRNAQLEEQTVAMPGMSGELDSYKERLDVLLLLLGTKEEELEAAYADMKEVKTMYRTQLDDLLNQMAPDNGTTTSVVHSSIAKEIDTLSLSEGEQSQSPMKRLAYTSRSSVSSSAASTPVRF